MEKNQYWRYDVTGKVYIAHPDCVLQAVQKILNKQYPDYDHTVLSQAFEVFSDLYAGKYAGYHGCDTWYHDTQHSLDATLALARLLDGYALCRVRTQQRNTWLLENKPQLTARQVVLGLIVALFHDSGYILREDETDVVPNGAVFTRTHVARSAEFLIRLLPTLGFSSAETTMVQSLVHFTGYEMALDDIQIHDPSERMLGFLLASADLLAQMSDVCYLEKCRDWLFHEFEFCGLAGDDPHTMYKTPQDLLAQTLSFQKNIWRERLDGYFEHVWRYMAVHFGGQNPYLDGVEAQMARLRAYQTDSFMALDRTPECINATKLNEILALQLECET